MSPLDQRWENFGAHSLFFFFLSKIVHLLIEIRKMRIKNPAGTILAQSTISYDEASYPLIAIGAVTNWTDPGTTVRGNITTIGKWLDTSGAYLQTHAQYDQCGSVRSAWDAKNNQSQIDYSSTYQFAYPTTTTTAVPDPSGQYGSTSALVTTAIFDSNTGLVLSTTDANSQMTSMAYSDPLNRLTQVTQPNGAHVSYIYSETPNDLYVRVLADEDASRVIETRKYFDNMGRAVRGFLYDGTPSTPWLVTDTYYDTMGRVSKVSNPYRVSSPSAAVPAFCSACTTTSYDALCRVLSVTTPDTAVVTSGYSGNAVTVTDQIGKKRKSVTDALGRLREVYEDPTGLNYLTSFSYDVLGNLITVTQGSQQRYFMYDSLSRLKRARNPEQSVNISLNLTDPQTGNSQWSSAYNYDANGNLAQKTDARGVTSTYTYDGLNRNTLVDYSDATPDSYRQYDLAINGKGRINQVWQSGTSTSATYVDQYDALGRPVIQRQRYETAGVWSGSYKV